MTARSVECEIGGKKYHLRFDRADVKALEQRLQASYLYFLNPHVFTSMTATEAFIHRGLRVEDRKGELNHAFALNEKGEEEAGELVFANMDEVTYIHDKILEAFIAAGMFKKSVGELQQSGEEPKN